jgi:hypothetical protein
MANVLNKSTFEYKKSVNTTEYLDGNWLINPDLSEVEGVETRFWKLVDSNVVEMTEEEKESVINSNIEIVKQTKIAALWQACFDYQSTFYTAPIFTRMSELKTAGDTRIVEVETWLNTLWEDYYTRRYMANHGTDVLEIQSISEDYTNNGTPPYTVAQLLGMEL